jgi:hypothetical protein
MQLPEHQHGAGCGCYRPDMGLSVQRPEGQAPQVVHVHQAPPDRTVQRVALGAGMGAGTVAAGVYFGPLLVGALTAMAAYLALLALLVAVICWAIVSVVRAVGGSEGQAAAKNMRKARKG